MFILLLSSCDTHEPSKPSKPSTPYAPLEPTVDIDSLYCQALVKSDQALKLSQIVVDAFNQSMGHLPSFVPAQVNSDGIRATVTFANSKPLLYYENPRGISKFHATLCYFSDSKWFKCADENLSRLVAKNATSMTKEEAEKEYAKYYENLIGKSFSFYKPRGFGSFLVIPLAPEVLVDSLGNKLSDEPLHVSVVKFKLSLETKKHKIYAIDLKMRLRQGFQNI